MAVSNTSIPASGTVKIKFAGKRNYGVNIGADFTGLAAAISLASKSSRISYLFGLDVQEELTVSPRALINLSAGSYRNGSALNALRRSYWGRTKTFDKIADFAERTPLSHPKLGLYGGKHFSAETIDYIAALDFSRERDRLSELCLNRATGVSFKDVDELFNRIDSSKWYGILCVPSSRPLGYSDTLVIRRWLDSNRPEPLIVIMEELRVSSLPYPAVPRSYIRLDDAVQTLAELFDKPLVEVSEAARLWTASLTGSRRELVSSNLITSAMISGLSNTARNFSLDPSQAALLVPPQISAVLAFDVEAGRIGLREAAAPQATATVLSGAARSIFELSDDLARSSSLGNIISGYDRKLARVRAVSKRMAAASTITDSDVLELGVQISALEALINQSKDLLGQHSTGEALIFFIEARSFLAQFPTWSEYQQRSPDQISIEAPELEAALAILKSFSADPEIFTNEARGRVEEVMPDTASESISPRIEGRALTDSAANLGKVAAQSVLSGVRELPKDIGIDLNKQLAKRVSKLIVENSGSLIRVAAAHREQWLDLAISFAKQHLGL